MRLPCKNCYSSNCSLTCFLQSRVARKLLGAEKQAHLHSSGLGLHVNRINESIDSKCFATPFVQQAGSGIKPLLIHSGRTGVTGGGQLAGSCACPLNERPVEGQFYARKMHHSRAAEPGKLYSTLSTNYASFTGFQPLNCHSAASRSPLTAVEQGSQEQHARDCS